MRSICLDTLPEELIGLIAVHADALSSLRLSQSCRKARSACFNVTIFREIVEASQYNLWAEEKLDVEAIASRARGNASIWARYALADHKAWNLSQEQPPFGKPREFIYWLPELYAVNHPSMWHTCWEVPLRNPKSMSKREVYCLALSILAQELPMLEVQHSLKLKETATNASLSQQEPSETYHWILCLTALTLRNELHQRVRAWPYNDSATNPYLSLPKPFDFTRARSTSWALPLPFSSCKNDIAPWDCWSSSRMSEGMRSCDAFVGTSWQGYYIHLYTEMLDPPMIDIKFEECHNLTQSRSEVMVQAKNCRDGIGSFEIKGSFAEDQGTIVFRGRKDYLRWGFDWKLSMGAFGLVGFWGNLDDGYFHKDGLVWLWKVDT